MTLTFDKLNGHGFSSIACYERLLQKTKVMYYQTIATSQNISVINVSAQMHSDKARLQLHSNNTTFSTNT